MGDLAPPIGEDRSSEGNELTNTKQLTNTKVTFVLINVMLVLVVLVKIKYSKPTYINY